MDGVRRHERHIIAIGADMQTNGTYFQYSQCEIDYVHIEYI